MRPGRRPLPRYHHRRNELTMPEDTPREPVNVKPSVFQPMDMPLAEAVLKEAKEILDSLGIVFFLRHGTCLGAVRDGALIPWDDDLDIASIIGLHGLTEEAIAPVADVFRERGFETELTIADLHVSLEFHKEGIALDWTCYRIIDDCIYQWPVLRIPVSLHTDLKPIPFLGEQFNVPNPPEEYLVLKYGPEWMTPKQFGYEQDVLSLMPDAPDGDSPDHLGATSGSLQVLDFDGLPVEGARVVVGSTTVLSGLVRTTTGADGTTPLHLPNDGYYVLEIRHGEHEEVLFLEKLQSATAYVYRPDPEAPAGRMNVLATYKQAADELAAKDRP